MQTLKLFYCPKREVYFYVTEDNLPLCDACKEEITANLVYHTIWMKKKVDIRMYHLGCHEKIQPRGIADEFKICVVTDKVPEDTLPVFERKPHLTSGKGDNVFDVHKILQGSEARIIDKTKLSRNPNQNMMVDFEKNLIEFHKRDDELGPSAFMAIDIMRDKVEQEKNEIIAPFQKGNGPNEDSKPKRSLIYDNDNLNLGKILFRNPSSYIDQFWEKTKAARILLPGQELDKITQFESEEKKRIEEKKQV